MKAENKTVNENHMILTGTMKKVHLPSDPDERFEAMKLKELEEKFIKEKSNIN
jgi:hypothetical protein